MKIFSSYLLFAHRIIKYFWHIKKVSRCVKRSHLVDPGKQDVVIFWSQGQNIRLLNLVQMSAPNGSRTKCASDGRSIVTYRYLSILESIDKYQYFFLVLIYSNRYLGGFSVSLKNREFSCEKRKIFL